MNTAKSPPYTEKGSKSHVEFIPGGYFQKTKKILLIKIPKSLRSFSFDRIPFELRDYNAHPKNEHLIRIDFCCFGSFEKRAEFYREMEDGKSESYLSISPYEHRITLSSSKIFKYHSDEEIRESFANFNKRICDSQWPGNTEDDDETFDQLFNLAEIKSCSHSPEIEFAIVTKKIEVEYPDDVIFSVPKHYLPLSQNFDSGSNVPYIYVARDKSVPLLPSYGLSGDKLLLNSRCFNVRLSKCLVHSQLMCFLKSYSQNDIIFSFENILLKIEQQFEKNKKNLFS